MNTYKNYTINRLLQKYIKKLIKYLLGLDVIVFCITKIIQLYLEVVFLTSQIFFEVDLTTEKFLTSKQVCFITLWHGRVLIFPKIMKKYGAFKVLTSLHKDGKYIDKFVRLYGHKTIRGSTYKGSLLATKDIVKSIKNSSIVITPDGPRGPGYKVNSAITNIATKFNIPIICISFSATKVKILNTWDKFMIPLPFTKIIVNISTPHYFEMQNNEKLEKLMLQQVKSLDKKCGV